MGYQVPKKHHLQVLQNGTVATPGSSPSIDVLRGDTFHPIARQTPPDHAMNRASDAGAEDAVRATSESDSSRTV